MCELFSLSCNNEIEINDYLKCFYEHCSEHPHGWGIALMDDNKTLLKKQPVKASESEFLREFISKPVEARNVFAHIRLATVGCMNCCNCHPFIQKDNNNRTWTLVHNGTIFSYPPLDKYKRYQSGVTDSERVLLHIVDEINKAEEDHKLTADERFNIIEAIVSKLAKNNKLNLMIYDGSVMYIHTNCEGGIHYLKTERGYLFSTKSLNCDKRWKHLPINTLYAIEDGQLKRTGKRHENSYHLTDENLRQILKSVPIELQESILRNFKLDPDEYLQTIN
ncbi:MAG: class II glutamine amidotransferase [Methanosphaera sp.]|uniref:class II glutamine amidotransferase n=1 Tax=Methanosphaera sp. TaxID=2666342 RepID=UPI0025E0FD85|nr:class II glutamine amidotransferase [Methanosphaera sp.]MCI5867113.1 class II glutamine amidotransferase [Methanosphaera sp.]MDD6535181.1 class II glutamine amidotransferase [Methanosphaera sp.]MDY3956501.1 class II glutamine amidotransferase [Methanosphaera sp.]